MTPEEALRLAKTIADLYGDASARLLATIAQAAARGVDRPQWAQQALGETLRLRDRTQAVVARLQADSSTSLVTLLEEVYAGGAGRTGLYGINYRSVEALARDTNRILAGVTPQVLRWSDDVYRSVVAEASGPAVVGGQARREALATALDRFAAQGVGGFTDRAGRRWQLDTYADMATRTAVGRAHIAGRVDGYVAQGDEWVIVSDSPEECPDCRPYEGKVLSLTGDQPPPDLSGLAYAGSLARARSAGFLHPNCTHNLGRFVPGLTRPHDGPTANADGYVDRQRQRALERRVRDSKRRVAALEPLGPTPQLVRQRALLKRRRDDLSTFNADHDRKEWVSRQRTRVRT